MRSYSTHVWSIIDEYSMYPDCNHFRCKICGYRVATPQTAKAVAIQGMRRIDNMMTCDEYMASLVHDS